MPRALRILPCDKLIHATNRCANSRFILAPNPRIRQLLIQRFHMILRFAKARYNITLYGAVLMSNHFHILFKAPSGDGSSFMRDVQSQLATYVNRLRGRTSPVFPRRFNHTVISDEPEAQLHMMQYLVLNPVKALLVKHPDHWPGYISHVSYRYPRGYERFDDLYDPLPCFDAWEDQYRQLTPILDTNREALLRGKRVLGRQAVLQTHWESRPGKVLPNQPRSLRDGVVSHDPAVGDAIAAGMQSLVAQWHEATAMWRRRRGRRVKADGFPGGLFLTRCAGVV